VLCIVQPAHLISRYRKPAFSASLIWRGGLRWPAVAFHAVIPGLARGDVGDVPRLPGALLGVPDRLAPNSLFRRSAHGSSMRSEVGTSKPLQVGGYCWRWCYSHDRSRRTNMIGTPQRYRNDLTDFGVNKAWQKHLPSLAFSIG
jgi:hypothetical protein